jgi:hypothetical protein
MKSVALKQETSLALAGTLDAWGTQEVSSQDILIPKILAMQGLSQLVADGKAAIGEMRDSVNGTLLGGIDKPLSFIPVHIDKVWVISEKKGDRFKYVGTEPITRDNENLPWAEITDSGKEIRRDYTMNCYCILPVDVENGFPVPYTISFRRTSLRAGKKLFTQMYVRNRQAGMIPPAMKMLLTVQRVKNDQGTFFVFDTDIDAQANQDEMNSAFDLFKTIQAGLAKVDDSDLVAHEEVVTNKPLSNQF